MSASITWHGMAGHSPCTGALSHGLFWLQSVHRGAAGAPRAPHGNLQLWHRQTMAVTILLTCMNVSQTTNKTIANGASFRCVDMFVSNSVCTCCFGDGQQSVCLHTFTPTGRCLALRSIKQHKPHSAGYRQPRKVHCGTLWSIKMLQIPSGDTCTCSNATFCCPCRRLFIFNRLYWNAHAAPLRGLSCLLDVVLSMMLM